MIKNNFLLMIFFSIIFFGCTKKQTSALFGNTVSNQPSILVLLSDTFIGSVPMGNTISSRISFRANGGLDIFGMSSALFGDSSFTFTGGSYPGTGGTCGSTLVSGNTCYIFISYTPTAITTNSTTLNFTYSDNVGVKSFSSILEADSHPMLTFEFGTEYDFGNKFVGTSTDLTITITNTGNRAANGLSVSNLTAPYRFKGGSYPGTGGNCGSSVALGATCNIVINYAPTANGEHLQDIALNYTNSGNPEQNILNLSGFGFFPAVLSLSDATAYDFGTKVANLDHDKVYTLTYVSGDVLATNIAVIGLTAPFNFKGGTFPGTGGTCTTSIRSGSCSIVLTMNSASSGTWLNNFNVQYHSGQSLFNIPRTIRGITKQKPVLSVTPNITHDFGLIHTASSSAAKTYTFTYVSGELPATSIGVTGLAAPFGYTGGSFPGTGGTCLTTLSTGSCTVVLSYNPITQQNLWQTTINLSYFDNIQTVQQSVLLRGSTESKLNFEVASIAFGNRVIGTQATLFGRIAFVGGIPATSITPTAPAIPFSYNGGGAFPGTSGNCSATLSSSLCFIYFTFAPVDGTTLSQNYSVTYFDGFATNTINLNLTGKGVPPAFLTIPNRDFGSTSTNSQVHSSITITNSTTMSATSVAALALPSGYTFKNGSYPGAGGTCGATIAAGVSCTLVLTFNPASAGTHTGNLTMSYNNGAASTSNSGQLTGGAVNSNSLFISSYDTYDFGTKFFSTLNDKTFTLTHGGGATTVTTIAPVALPADYSFLGGTFPGTGGTCGTTLTSGSSCTFVVRFSPQSTGTKNASIIINYNNGINTSATRLITGVGLSPAILTISPKPHDYGPRPIGNSYERVFTVTASGQGLPTTWTADILGTGFSFKGGSYPGTGGTCAATYVSPSCTIVVIFSPTAVTAYSGTPRIQYFNQQALVYATTDVTGTGTGSAILSFTNASPYDFGKVVQTSSTEATLIINNSGTLEASALSSSVLNAPFSYKGGSYPGTGGTCGSTLAVGNCTIVVRYSPSTTAINNSALTISYFNGNLTTNITTILTGEGIAQAILSISDGSPYAFGSVVVGSTLSKIFTVINGGETQSSSMNGTFTSAAFHFKGGTYPGTGGTCAATLGSTASCTLAINFSPTALGAAAGTFKLNYNDGLGAQIEFKNLTGTGLASFQASSLLSMIPIKKIDTSEPAVFFTEALKINVDQIKLSNGISITGRDTLVIKDGLHSEYYSLLEDGNEVPSTLSSWGLSKLNIQDINHDDVDDFVVSRFNPNSFTNPDEQIVFSCYSGLDLSVLYTVTVPNPSNLLAGLSSVMIPEDKDQDGFNDFITGLYKLIDKKLILRGYIIFSSRTGVPIEHVE